MYDVAIVGAGPVGVVAANLCGQQGLSAVAFDREPDVYDLPRAAGLHDDAQRILHNAGLLDAILPSTDEMLGAEFVDAAGKRIIGFELPSGTLLDNGYPALLNIDQPGLERAIRACLSNYPGVELRVAHEVSGFEQHDDHVELEVRDLEADAASVLQARWLLGADGASSFVRKTSGIGWHSLGYDCEWLVIDLEITSDVELTPLCQQICDPYRPVTVVPMPGRQRRWEFQLRPGETRAEMEDPDRVWQLLEPWLSRDAGVLLRAVVYRFHATIADTFRDGRVFLAGDAAHQTPPFMGQGLCTGIRDVENLIWKLAMVRDGRAGDHLLETYTAERRPLAVAMVQHSTNTGKLIDAYAAMARGGPEPSPELQEYAYGGSRRLPDLADGLLERDGGPAVGQLLPHVEVATSDGTAAFDDAVGQRWAVVSKNDPYSLMDPETRDVWQGIGAVPVAIPAGEGPAAEILGMHELVIVRPDRIVYGTASAAGIAALTKRLMVALGS